MTPAARYAQALASSPRRSKYGAVKTTVGDVTYDSKKEASRIEALKVMERAGEITNLRTQPKFPMVVNGKLICNYVADALYYDATGALVIEDVKSAITRKNPVYRLKIKLLAALYNIEIREV